MNQTILIGRLTKDPELGYTQNNKARCTFTLAVDRPRQSGQEQSADFIRVVVWNRQAETCSQYLGKGSQCAVRGSIRTGSYKNRDGATVYTTDVWADRVEFIGSSRADNRANFNSQSQYDDYGVMGRNDNSQMAQEESRPSADDWSLPDAFDFVDDGIPF